MSDDFVRDAMQGNVNFLKEKCDKLKAELDRAKLEIESLEGNLGHAVRSGAILPLVAENVLAGSIAIERDKLSLLAESYRAILAFYAALSNVPLTEIIDAYQSGGTAHDCLLKYTERARAALDTNKT